MIAATISHYSVREKLGEGGMGVVYKAEDTLLQRFVALKFLPEEYAHDAGLRERFLREARAASALNHPSICTIYEVGEEQGRIFIAMEYLDGRNLKELFRSRPLPFEQLLSIAADVIEGLAAAHSEGIIHRDVKLANILVTKRGRAKILDFGLAKKTRTGQGGLARSRASSGGDRNEISQMTSGLAALGTAAYMSPEQALGRPLDERTDLFSFGVVLYEMATGKAPFQGDTTGTLFLSIMQEVPEAPRTFNPEIPEELQRIISKCLEKDRERRYQHASEILADLQRLRRISGAHEALTEALHETALLPERSSSSWGQQRLASGPRVLHRPRRKWLRVSASATTIIALIAAGIFYLPSHKAQAIGAQSGIVIADFTNTTEDPIFDGTLRQAVALDLAQSPFVNVVSGRRMAAALKQMGRSGDERLSREVAREVCLRTNSTALIAGSISQSGTAYRLQLQALNCETGKTIANVESEAPERSQVLRTLGVADGQLRRKLGESLPSLQKFGKPLAEATTSSLEALQAFSAGERLRQEKGNTEALPYFQRAVELDPNFALAYAVMGNAYQGSSEPTLARESLQRAFELRNRVSEAEHFFIETLYYQTVSQDSVRVVETCQEWIRSYPGDSYPHARLASQYGHIGQYREGVQELREAIRLAPDVASNYTNLVLYYMQLKRLDEAQATFDAARVRKIDSENLELVRYDLAFVEGDTAAMQELVESAKTKQGYRDRMALQAALSRAYFGHFDPARDFARQAISTAIAGNAKEAAAEHAAHYALMEAEAGNKAAALEFASKALNLGHGSTVVQSAALAFVRTGKITAAQELMEQLDSDYPVSTIVQNYTLPTIQAAIELQRQHPNKAVELLERAKPYEFAMASYADLHPAYLRGLAYLQLGEGQKAATEFQKVIDNPGLVVNSIIGALGYLQLARAEQLSGDHDAARTHYQDFLALWKDADPDVPTYQEAKIEYAKLKTMR